MVWGAILRAARQFPDDNVHGTPRAIVDAQRVETARLHERRFVAHVIA
jgi:hypothetical protein